MTILLSVSGYTWLSLRTVSGAFLFVLYRFTIQGTLFSRWQASIVLLTFLSLLEVGPTVRYLCKTVTKP